MLDTNIVSDLLRNPTGKVEQKIRKVGVGAICISIITAAELRFGCVKRNAPRLTHMVEQLLSELEIVPFDAAADANYAEIRNYLEQSGKPIGPNDLLIAAHARSLDAVLVTANAKEFDRVSGLRVGNWLM